MWFSKTYNQSKKHRYGDIIAFKASCRRRLGDTLGDKAPWHRLTNMPALGA